MNNSIGTRVPRSNLENLHKTYNKSFETAYQMQNDLKSQNLEIKSKLEDIFSNVTALTRGIEKVDENMNEVKEDLLLAISQNQNGDVLKNLSSDMMQNKNEIKLLMQSSLTNIFSMPLVKLVGGKTSSEGLVYVKGRNASIVQI